MAETTATQEHPSALKCREELGDVPARAIAFKIEDANDREMAIELLADLRERKRRGQEAFKEPKQKADQAHKAICKLEKDVLAETVRAETHVESQMRTWDNAVRAREAEEARKAEELRKKQEEERAAELARQAEERRKEAEAIGGDDPEAVAVAEQTLEAAAPPPAPEPPPPPPDPAPTKLQGRRAKWVARVDNLEALVKAVAAGQVALKMLLPNMVELNKLARTVNSEREIVSGVTAIDEGAYVGR